MKVKFLSFFYTSMDTSNMKKKVAYHETQIYGLSTTHITCYISWLT